MGVSCSYNLGLRHWLEAVFYPLKLSDPRPSAQDLMMYAALGASAAHIHGVSRAEYHGSNSLRSPPRRSAAVMSAALHLATVDDAEDFLLSSMCSHSLESVLTLDDAPKLAHSIAIDLEDALAGATLPISEEGSAGITVVISEAEDLGARQACLDALRVPEAMWELATLHPRDYGALLDVGFCSRAGTDTGDGGRCITLVNGQKVQGLQASRAEQAILDATAVLADELADHFEFSLNTGQDTPGLVFYGGRAVDGCLVGVLGMRAS